MTEPISDLETYVRNNTGRRFKHFLRVITQRAGIEISRYRPRPTVSELFPQARHADGFIYDVLGNMLYQNVTDIINHTWEQGKSREELRKPRYGEIAYILNTVRAGETVLDIGANIGFYTLALAQCVGATGRVIAFEPGPLSFGLLTANTMINNYRNVTLVNKAVGAKPGRAFYYSDATAESGSAIGSIDLEYDHPRTRIELDVITLDDYFGNTAPSIDYIKMDIEGSEYAALHGMQRLLTANRDIRMTIEYAPYQILWRDTDLAEFLCFVRGMGFRIHDLALGPDDAVSDDYLLNTYPKSAIGKYATLLLHR